MAESGGRHTRADSLAGRRLRVLALTEEIPYPPDSGWKLRTWNLLLRLAPLHDITLVTPVRPDQTAAVRALESQGFRVVAVAQSPRRKQGPFFYLSLVANLLDPLPYVVRRHSCSAVSGLAAALLRGGSFDVVHCDWTPLSMNVPDWALARTVVTAHNIETRIWQRYQEVERSPLRRWYIGRQTRKMQSFEVHALSAAAVTVTVSDDDASIAQRLFGCRAIRVVPNGVDTDHFVPSTEDGRPGRLLYVGSMDTIANSDAVVWFCREVLPRVSAECQGTSLDIVGRRPTAAVRHLSSHTHVRVTGHVADLRPYYADAQVVVVPLRVGGGTRLKILEAWAAGRPVVSTTVGCEGLAAANGANIVIADDPTDFAEAVTRLLRDPDARLQLGAEGRHTAVTQYDWSSLSSGLSEAWYEASAAAPLGDT